MKRLSFFASALALIGLCFTSCKEPAPGPDLDEVIEDGFYVAGDATGSTELELKYRMAAGLNEADGNKAREGLYEKYIALEADKDFYLTLHEGLSDTRYSAELADLVIDGADYQVNMTARSGAVKTGADAPAMKVTESGLYHITLDLDKDQKLGGAVLVVAPVKWYVNIKDPALGDEAPAFTELSNEGFNKDKMVYTKTFTSVNMGNFKFAYGQGWKIYLDNAHTVAVNTNLGVDMINGGKDIPLPKGKNVTIKLTWTLAKGSIADSYKMELTGDFEYVDPATFVVGFSGNAFPTPNDGWGDPDGATKAEYNAVESKVKDSKTFAGTYVYDIAGLSFAAGKEFKARFNGAWIGTGENPTIEGATFTDNSGNFLVGADATYDIKMTVEWNGAGYDSFKIAFTKK